jgi:GT2 family glycosyltransferase
MNAVAMLAYNTTDKQLELTINAVQSVLTQDIPTHLWIVNNGSTEPTAKYFDTLLDEFPERVSVITNQFNVPPVKATNALFHMLFNHREVEYVLGVPNDVVLPLNAYSEMLKWPRGIVTATQTGEIDFPRYDKATALSECTPMAVALIRKWVFDALIDKDGYFLDPRFEFYASDCDLALRIAACGIRGVQLDFQYWHYCSASHRLAAPGVARGVTLQADVDRRHFEEKWGFSVTDEAYGQSCGNINFRGAPIK